MAADCTFILGERPSSVLILCRHGFVSLWSLVAGKKWGFSHDLVAVGRVSQVVVRYRSDSMGKRSVDGKVVVYARWSFVTGVARTREYCNYNT